MDNNINWEQKYYLAVRQVRDFLALPVARVFDKIGLTPNILTGLGFSFFIFFFILVVLQNKYALPFLILGLAMDMFDGALARVQNRESDKGKFVDVLFDAINFVIFILSLIYLQFISGVVGAVFIFLITLSKILRMIFHAKTLPTDWLFKPVAGFVPILLIILSFLFSGIHYFYRFLPMNYIFIFFSLILIIDSLYFLKKIYNLN